MSVTQVQEMDCGEYFLWGTYFDWKNAQEKQAYEDARMRGGRR
tara:strand:+ start:8643 stop:8771 length:129 start_codon:yes stop_codon:yes gene_type:complete